MNSIKYDEPRLKEMQDFIQYIYNLGVQNPNLVINHNLVYRELCKLGMDEQELSETREQTPVKPVFQEWINRNTKSGNYQKGLRVEHHLDNLPQFLQFFSCIDGEEILDANGFIKLYIPLKYKGLFDKANELFDFITNSGIRHASKIADRMRSDNVVVRLEPDDYESALRIISFMSRDSMKGSLNPVNPFVPSIHGIGIMQESGISYNGQMATLIADYVNYCIKNMRTPLIDDFYEWFIKNSYDQEIDGILKCALGKTKELIYPTKDETRGLNIGSNDSKDEFHFIDLYSSPKDKLFLECLLATYQKYGLDQAISAITHLNLLENYNCFSNGDKSYRDRMMKEVTKEDVIDCIKRTVGNKEINNQTIALFCYRLFGKDLIDRLARVSAVTLNKHGINQLKYALKLAVNTGNFNGFSGRSLDPEDKTYYRGLISNISSKYIYDIMCLSLGMGISSTIDNLDYVVNAYVRKLINYLNILEDVSGEKTL